MYVALCGCKGGLISLSRKCPENPLVIGEWGASACSGPNSALAFLHYMQGRHLLVSVHPSVYIQVLMLMKDS